MPVAYHRWYGCLGCVCSVNCLSSGLKGTGPSSSTIHAVFVVGDLRFFLHDSHSKRCFLDNPLADRVLFFRSVQWTCCETRYRCLISRSRVNIQS